MLACHRELGKTANVPGYAENGRPEITSTGKVKPQGMGGYKPPHNAKSPRVGHFTWWEIDDPYECQDEVE
jgi:hypothetical protein